MQAIQRPAAELIYREELQKLYQDDQGKPRPSGWVLTPASVVTFVLGDARRGITQKFVGSRAVVERCVVAMATQRGLLLVGEPGTAKSYLSELLAAAISANSTLTIQGSAGTIEDNIKYSWNYALLLSEGASLRSLVPAPLYHGMSRGQIVRFEEITRCPVEIQDVLLSILSERVMMIPELPDDSRVLYAKQGFNVIATANTRDRGINEMSAALKRRFNFETVQPIADIQQEMALVKREAERLFAQSAIPVTLPADMTEILVTTFHELRRGVSAEGDTVSPLSTVMSTAEAVSAAYAAGIHAYYYGTGQITPEVILHSVLGSAVKESADDLNKLKVYFNTSVKKKAGAAWRAYFEARTLLDPKR
jgi:MoxR-like ATPase